ncbi:HDOD domain-containing protein [Motiliproteus sp. MSK22-1]|uniref:HDOD domain-containing protein n=1 Tax=Motiliproteus sp. MSK22-1 TaxID=1897630 RepID=UPI0009763E8A|nr:HDOD domain-containing protein [Motiliproteus sp. MSK22-1]OMH38858.1 hypothetical protein BGP75_00320 [Motiliproteus sp. MSK22-1]
MSWSVTETVAKCEDIASLPEAYHKISEKLDQPTTTNNELAEVVKLEPGITGKLLSIVNSAFYGFSNTISTASQAISIVGRNDFRNLVLGTTVAELFEQIQSGTFSMRDYWEHALLCAICSKMLGEQWKIKEDREALFIAGLLHDVGKLVIVQVLPDKAELLIPYWQDNPFEYSFEQQLLGFDHAEVGAELMKSWGLPGILVEATGCHHQPNKAEINKHSSHAVFIANVLAHNDEHRVAEALAQCREAIAINDDIDTLLELQQEALRKRETLIGIFLG